MRYLFLVLATMFFSSLFATNQNFDSANDVFNPHQILARAAAIRLESRHNSVASDEEDFSIEPIEINGFLASKVAYFEIENGHLSQDNISLCNQLNALNPKGRTTIESFSMSILSMFTVAERVEVVGNILDIAKLFKLKPQHVCLKTFLYNFDHRKLLDDHYIYYLKLADIRLIHRYCSVFAAQFPERKHKSFSCILPSLVNSLKQLDTERIRCIGTILAKQESFTANNFLALVHLKTDQFSNEELINAILAQPFH